MELFVSSVENFFSILLDWAKSLKEFNEFDIDDQICLIKASKLHLAGSAIHLALWFDQSVIEDWRELLCCSITYRSLPYDQALLLSNGHLFQIASCLDQNLAPLFQHISIKIIPIMKEMRTSPVEIACLKYIILFDPGKSRLRASK